MTAKGKKRRRLTAEQKLKILDEARQPITAVAEVRRRHQIDAATFYRCRVRVAPERLWRLPHSQHLGVLSVGLRVAARRGVSWFVGLLRSRTLRRRMLACEKSYA